LKTEVDILKTEIHELRSTINKLQENANNSIWLDSSDIKQFYHISDSTLIRYRKENKIPYTKLGGRFLYPKKFFTESLMAKMENKELL
jgi:hypothetical protein